jgi:hypothetical protein
MDMNPTTTTMDRRRGSEAHEHGTEIPARSNRFRDRPGPGFRPHEGPPTGYFFANGSAPAKKKKAIDRGDSGLG